VASFAERAFRDAFTADNRREDIDAYCEVALTSDLQRQYIADETMDTLLIEDSAGHLVGYAQLRPGSPPEVTSDAPLELWRFYVDRHHHGRGIAQQLMQAVLAAAATRGARSVWLGVWERNHRALAFYRKSGFVDIGSHTFVLGSDVQTDRLMARPVER
jgi:ribosomal protein S18 acetylase RimI-like enzyme